MLVKKIVILLMAAALAESQSCPYSTTANGNPMTDNAETLTAGDNGPTLMEDMELLDELSHFDRERVPERAVHAKGFGVRGYFEVTGDITQYSAANVFSEVGKRTPLVARFSGALRDKGYPDTALDIRGLALKFYTEDGIWDLLTLNLPVFLVNDPRLFTNFNHAVRRDPATNLFNLTSLWDFLTLRPETTHAVLWLFSAQAIPLSMRHINVFSINTYRLVNEDGNFVYCRFNLYTNQGVQNLTNARAREIRSTDPDYYARDMINSINNETYPSWTLTVQIVAPSEADLLPFNPLDVTKLWPESSFPPIEIGQIVLNENVRNHFEEVEQIGFSPMNMVPGIRPSTDKFLQARLFAYMDTQRHRIGPNFLQLPINRPAGACNFQRDGPMTFDNQATAPNYYPNSFGGPEPSIRARNLSAPYDVLSVASRYSSTDEYTSQARDFYVNTLTEEDREILITNLAGSIMPVEDFIKIRAVDMFSNVDDSLGQRFAERVLVPNN